MKRLMKFLTVLLVVQLLFGAAMVEAQPRAAHDNIVQQARCRTLMSGIERCGLRGGPQVVTAADKSFHVAYATWKVNGVEWLIARDVDDLRVYAYPPT
ncbi:MAG: hypothetical protein HKN37_16395, partial [Rhodothermales bacterium]|nr:hypothetical protein [Rhodothermales bacterium]